MSELVIATESDGSKWVQLEDYESLRKVALESKVIIEQFQKLLGVYTSTEAFARIIELQKASRPTPDQADASSCPSCGAKKGECFVWCPRGD